MGKMERYNGSGDRTAEGLNWRSIQTALALLVHSPDPLYLNVLRLAMGVGRVRWVESLGECPDVAEARLQMRTGTRTGHGGHDGD